MPCPDGLTWNEATKKCDWPHLSNCEVTCGGKKRSDVTIMDSGSCNVDCSTGYYLKANPRDCHSYFSCVHGNPVEMPCPDGLTWNEATKRCDWPHLSNCEVTCGGKHIVGPTNYGKMDWCDAPKCKTIIGLLANPGNCSSYYSCNDYMPIRMPCPKHLEFDAEAKLCNWPKLANCVQTCKERTDIAA